MSMHICPLKQNGSQGLTLHGLLSLAAQTVVNSADPQGEWHCPAVMHAQLLDPLHDD